MGIMDGLVGLFESLFGELINIPLINPLSFIYVILNIMLLLLGGFRDFQEKEGR
jgi:hypothetical protein